MEGLAHTKPQLKKISFAKKGYIEVYFNDGRILLAPLKFFPSIKKTKPALRNKYQIADGNTVVFIYCNEVYHIQDFLGIYENYKYNFA